jgi:tRNA pseudouridine65 synthase
MDALRARVLYGDNAILIVDKPPGLLVHPNPHERGAPTCLGQMRDIAGQEVRTVHRIDRATSGLVLFAIGAESAGRLASQFRDRTVGKGYLAIVRGHILAPRTVDLPVPRDLGIDPVPSRTDIVPLTRAVLREPVGRYDEGWFTLAAVELRTGRMHQARKHLHHIDHPVIGDKKHGDRAQNRFFLQRFGAEELFLRAYSLRFLHPVTGRAVTACAGLPGSWLRVMASIGLEPPPALAREAAIDIGTDRYLSPGPVHG